MAGSYRSAADDPAHQSGGLYRDCLCIFAVYGTADLHRVDTYRLFAGGSGAGSWGPTAENVL